MFNNLISEKKLLFDASISLVFLFMVLYFVGFEKVLGLFNTVNYFLLFISIFFLLLMYIAMVLRLKLVLEVLGKKLSFFELFKAHLFGMLLADITPARTGYLATVYALKRKNNVESEKGMVAVLGSQIYDFSLKILIALFGLLYILQSFLNSNARIFLFTGVFLMLLILFSIILLLFSSTFLNFISFLNHIPYFSSIFSKFHLLFKNAQKNSSVLIKLFPQLFFILLLTWSFKALSWYFVAKSLNITLNSDFEPLFYFFIQPLLTLLEFIPSPTLAGLGVSEGGAIFLLSVFGVSPEESVAFMLLARLKTFLVNLPAIPYLLSLFKPNKVSSSV